jgi:hypothetical protein
MANGGSAGVRTPFPGRDSISAALIVLGSLRRRTAHLSFVSQGAFSIGNLFATQTGPRPARRFLCAV